MNTHSTATLKVVHSQLNVFYLWVSTFVKVCVCPFVFPSHQALSAIVFSMSGENCI